MSESPAVVVYLPCDVSAVRARVDIGDSLSPIEKIVLRVIAASPCTASRLAELLGLGHRVTLDILHDLWRHDHLLIDFADNLVDVSQDIRDKIKNGQLDRVAGLEAEEIRRELMIEKLTGHVLPCRGPRTPPLPRFAVDHPRSEVSLETAPVAAVVAALNQALSSEERRGQAADDDIDDFSGEGFSLRTGMGRPRRVRSILTMPQDLRGVSGRRWLALQVRATLNEDTDDVVVKVIDRTFPAERREFAGELITRLAREFRTESFAVELRKAAGGDLFDAPPLHEAVSRLAESAVASATIPAGKRLARHRELCDDARQISGLLHEAITREVAADIVVGDEHKRLVSDLIRQARRQLVIVCPSIKPDTMKEFEEPLRRKIRSGVRVILIWGRGYEDKLSGPAGNSINSLAREPSTAPMLLPLTSARTRANVVIADDRAALVTSCNVLSLQPGRRDIGVVIRSAEGEHSQAVRDLLDRVRTMVPDGRMSRQVAVYANDFSTQAAPLVLQPPALPEPPPDDMAADNPLVANAVRAWTAAWTAFARGLEQAAARPAPVATPVVDSDHRELLWRALRTAKWRLVVISELLGPDVCDTRFHEAVTECLNRGVIVTLGFGHTGQGADGVRAAEDLVALAAQHPGKLHVWPRGNHARVLIWDDECVVGSFNYLSYAGFAIGASYRQQSELSVHLSGKAAANRVAEVAGTSHSGAAPRDEELAAARPAAAGTSVRDEAVTESVRAAQRIRNGVVMGSDIGDVVAKELAESEDPWDVLEALGAAVGTPDIDAAVQAAAAYCLLHYRDRADRHRLRTWTERMILAQWQAGRYPEAALLRCAYPGEMFRPRTWLAVVAAVRGSPESEDAIIAASDIDLLAEERDVLLLVTAAHLLHTGSSWATSLLEELAPQAHGAWRDLGKLVLAYGESAPGVRPHEILAAGSLPGKRGQEDPTPWAALEDALARSRTVPVVNAPGKKTHFALFRPVGVFGRLAESAARRDRAALDGIFQELLGGHANMSAAVAELVDRTWTDVAPHTNPLQGGRRTRYLKRLEDVVVALGTVLETDEDGGRSLRRKPAGTAEQQAAVQVLSEGLRSLWPALQQAASEIPDPERRLVLSVLDDLGALPAVETT